MFDIKKLFNFGARKFELETINDLTFLKSADKNLTSAKLPKEVTCINKGAFENCVNLTEVILPDGLKAINENAFCGCESLESIVVPSGVKKISAGAFKNCKNLKSAEFLGTQISFQDEVFSGCENLTTLKTPNNITGIGKNVFAGCKKLKIEEKYKKITLSDGSSTLFFSGCDIVEEVIVTSAVKHISLNAFANSSLSKISLPEGLLTIGKNAFVGCKNLKEITIPSTVKHISNGAFDTPHMVINYKGTEEQWGDVIYKLDIQFKKGECLVDTDPDAMAKDTYIPNHDPFVKEFTVNVKGEDNTYFVPLVCFKGTEQEWKSLDRDGLLTKLIIQKEKNRLAAGASAYITRPKYIVTPDIFYTPKDIVVNFK